MTNIRHRPDDDLLLAYSAGTLRGPEATVVAAHLAFSDASRATVRTLEAVGGALLDALPATPLDADALRRMMSRIDADGGEVRPPAPLNDMPELPEPLRRLPLGPWRRVGTGVRVRRVETPRDGDCRLILVEAAPGRRLPEHGHAGVELTCILAGAYATEEGRFGPGDFEAADEDVSHQPVVVSSEPCLCLIALDGEIRLPGLVGRLMQPFVRL